MATMNRTLQLAKAIKPTTAQGLLSNASAFSSRSARASIAFSQCSQSRTLFSSQMARPTPAGSSQQVSPLSRELSTLSTKPRTPTSISTKFTSPILSQLRHNATSSTASQSSQLNYVEEGVDMLPDHQPRIIVGDPARGRWTITGVHAWAIAFLMNFIVFAFLIMDFIDDVFTYWGMVVSEELGR